ncbi:unnamed protein product [Rhizophagus irregularis]|uniref:Peptidase A2 domain-containing protein n=1 Tax=Rhizophagus irregularis TaxID=588596 RepID=A0A2N1NI39_9GLOM|nr:hypothetical protein RhiirC2_775880 [Rhizophagus irregularis]CAB4377845.1 unnamed protein product [Rhizophagus irregularis]CAB5393517.1 unnamed protein product [Rhizophagus irregularis]
MRLLSLVKAYKVPYYNYKKPAIVGIKTICTLDYYKKLDISALEDLITHDFSDIKKDWHEKLSELYNHSDQELDEINGFLYGRANRFFGLMKATISGKTKNAYFLIDTGSPRTYISAELLNAYNITVSNETHHDIILNKRPITAGISPATSIFSYLNILGMDYMSSFEAKLHADFEEKKFTIKLKPR